LGTEGNFTLKKLTPLKAVSISTQNLRLKKDKSGKQATAKVALTQSIDGFFAVFATYCGKSVRRRL
jgi:phage terminase large subunit-like protein